ncbi:hypothetical protein HPB47_023599, partial [Ixodes persulcatus]
WDGQRVPMLGRSSVPACRRMPATLLSSTRISALQTFPKGTRRLRARTTRAPERFLVRCLS